MKDFFDYIIPGSPNDDYNIDAIVRDIWRENGYPGKLDTVAMVMQFSRGRLSLKEVIEAFNRIKNERG